MKKIFSAVLIATVAITGTAYGQYSGDAIKFSQSNYGTSARFKGMGGAVIGVGGDLSSLGGNPAGLGLFTKSEFSLTPEFSNISTSADYLGQGLTTRKSSPNFSQAGAALYLPTYRMKGSETTKGIVSLVVGLGYSRTGNYDNEFNFSGTNNRSSFADYPAELAGSTPSANFGINSLENWAYQDYLISYDNVANNYFAETYADATTGNLQIGTDMRKGGSSELNFSAALNISNQFYVGINVGLVSMRYTRDAMYTESGTARLYTSSGTVNGTGPYSFDFIQNQITTGEGLNGRVGVIFRPSPEFRIGATIQTPTYLNIEDSYTETLDNRRSTNGHKNSNTYDYDYRLRTPLKASLGASYIIGGTALISADVDYVDYSSTRLSELSSYQSELMNNNNALIRTTYTEAVNFRVGGEYKLNNLSLRAGYGFNGSAYLNNSDLSSSMYSAGLGYRINNYYLDFAYQRIEGSGTYSPYTLNNFTEPVANLSTSKDNMFLTIGVRF